MERVSQEDVLSSFYKICICLDIGHSFLHLLAMTSPAFVASYKLQYNNSIIVEPTDLKGFGLAKTESLGGLQKSHAHE